MGKQTIDLAQFDDDFRSEATEERGDFESVPDGKYQVAVEKVELTQSSTGNPMLKWTLRILAPRFVNRFLWVPQQRPRAQENPNWRGCAPGYSWRRPTEVGPLSGHRARTAHRNPLPVPGSGGVWSRQSRR